MNLDEFKNLINYIHSQLNVYGSTNVLDTEIVIKLFTSNEDKYPFKYVPVTGMFVGEGKDSGKLFLISDSSLQKSKEDLVKEHEKIIKEKDKKIKSLEEHLTANSYLEEEMDELVLDEMNRRYGALLKENLDLKQKYDEIQVMLKYELTNKKNTLKELEEIETKYVKKLPKTKTEKVLEETKKMLESGNTTIIYEPGTEPTIKRGRGRPRKTPIPEGVKEVTQDLKKKIRRRPGRPRKTPIENPENEKPETDNL